MNDRCGSDVSKLMRVKSIRVAAIAMFVVIAVISGPPGRIPAAVGEMSSGAEQAPHEGVVAESNPSSDGGDRAVWLLATSVIGLVVVFNLFRAWNTPVEPISQNRGNTTARKEDVE